MQKKLPEANLKAEKGFGWQNKGPGNENSGAKSLLDTCLKEGAAPGNKFNGRNSSRILNSMAQEAAEKERKVSEN